MSRRELIVQALLPHQEPTALAASSRKVVRAGRRWGKTRLGWHCAVLGHGGGKGLVHGGDVVWIAPDYPQASQLWNEEIRPRASNVYGIDLNATERTMRLQGHGTLHVRSGEAIDGVRGLGDRVAGVIVDEAAHIDLEYALTRVLLPILLDNNGWLLLTSTTNSGKDGNPQGRTPSWFNLICEQIESGKRGGEWQSWHGTARDNPKINADGVAELLAEYGTNTHARDEEVEALLLPPGAGLAFPEWDDRLHVIPNRVIPDSWYWYATLDWGMVQGAYHLHAIGPDGDKVTVWEYYTQFRGKHAADAALNIFRESGVYPTPSTIYYDGQMDQDTGVKGGMTLKDEWTRGMLQHFREWDLMPNMTPTVKGPKSRLVKKNAMHVHLAVKRTADGAVPIDPATGVMAWWARPQLRIMQRCTEVIREMKALPLKDDGSGDVDSSASDHGYDSLAMLLVAHPARPMRTPGDPPRDTHPGIDPFTRARRKPQWQVELERIQNGEFESERHMPGRGELVEWSE